MVRAVPSNPGWQAGYERNQVGGALAGMLAPAGGFGKFVVMLALSLLGNTCCTIYAITLSFQTLVPWLARVPRYLFSLVTTAIVIPVAIAAVGDFLVKLENFVALIGYWSAAFVAIVATEHLVFRRARFDAYDAAAWDTTSRRMASRTKSALLLFGSGKYTERGGGDGGDSRGQIRPPPPPRTAAKRPTAGVSASVGAGRGRGGSQAATQHAGRAQVPPAAPGPHRRLGAGPGPGDGRARRAATAAGAAQGRGRGAAGAAGAPPVGVAGPLSVHSLPRRCLGKVDFLLPVFLSLYACLRQAVRLYGGLAWHIYGGHSGLGADANGAGGGLDCSDDVESLPVTKLHGFVDQNHGHNVMARFVITAGSRDPLSSPPRWS